MTLSSWFEAAPVPAVVAATEREGGGVHEASAPSNNAVAAAAAAATAAAIASAPPPAPALVTDNGDDDDTDVRLKIVLDAGHREIRRTCLRAPTFDDVLRCVDGFVAAPVEYVVRYTLEYLDDDGDAVTLGSSEEWAECLKIHKALGAPRLLLCVDIMRTRVADGVPAHADPACPAFTCGIVSPPGSRLAAGQCGDGGRVLAPAATPAATRYQLPSDSVVREFHSPDVGCAAAAAPTGSARESSARAGMGAPDRDGDNDSDGDSEYDDGVVADADAPPSSPGAAAAAPVFGTGAQRDDRPDVDIDVPAGPVWERRDDVPVGVEQVQVEMEPDVGVEAPPIAVEVDDAAGAVQGEDAGEAAPAVAGGEVDAVHVDVDTAPPSPTALARMALRTAEERIEVLRAIVDDDLADPAACDEHHCTALDERITRVLLDLDGIEAASCGDAADDVRGTRRRLVQACHDIAARVKIAAVQQPSVAMLAVTYAESDICLMREVVARAVAAAADVPLVTQQLLQEQDALLKNVDDQVFKQVMVLDSVCLDDCHDADDVRDLRRQLVAECTEMGAAIGDARMALRARSVGSVPAAAERIAEEAMFGEAAAACVVDEDGPEAVSESDTVSVPQGDVDDVDGVDENVVNDGGEGMDEGVEDAAVVDEAAPEGVEGEGETDDEVVEVEEEEKEEDESQASSTLDAPVAPAAFADAEHVRARHVVKAYLNQRHGPHTLQRLLEGATTPAQLGCLNWLQLYRSRDGVKIDVRTWPLYNQLMRDGVDDMKRIPCEAAGAWALFNLAVQLDPEWPLAWYNRAAARLRDVTYTPEGLEDPPLAYRTAIALADLTRAVDCGYADAAQLRGDEDLVDLRGLPEFEALLERTRLHPTPPAAAHDAPAAVAVDARDANEAPREMNGEEEEEEAEHEAPPVQAPIDDAALAFNANDHVAFTIADAFPDHPHVAELAVLHDMGFPVDAGVAAAVSEAGGDIGAVLEMLLAGVMQAQEAE